jgi:hypothetical protein
MAVARPKVSFEAGAPKLFDPHAESTQYLFQYDVTPDGKRFLVGAANSASSQPLTVVVNPQAEWKKEDRKASICRTTRSRPRPGRSLPALLRPTPRLRSGR